MPSTSTFIRVFITTDASWWSDSRLALSVFMMTILLLFKSIGRNERIYNFEVDIAIHKTLNFSINFEAKRHQNCSHQWNLMDLNIISKSQAFRQYHDKFTKNDNHFPERYILINNSPKTDSKSWCYSKSIQRIFSYLIYEGIFFC